MTGAINMTGSLINELDVVFIRKDVFYPVRLLDPEDSGVSIDDQIVHHVDLNPGTLRIERIDRTVIWRLQ